MLRPVERKYHHHLNRRIVSSCDNLKNDVEHNGHASIRFRILIDDRETKAKTSKESINKLAIGFMIGLVSLTGVRAT